MSAPRRPPPTRTKTFSRRRNLDASELDRYDHVASGLLGRVRIIRTNLLPPAADGVTLGRFVFLRGDQFDRIEGVASKLMAHELVHVRQFAELGPIPFLGRYLGEYFVNLWRLRSHRAAYLAISFEREARLEAEKWAKSRSEPGS